MWKGTREQAKEFLLDIAKIHKDQTVWGVYRGRDGYKRQRVALFVFGSEIDPQPVEIGDAAGGLMGWLCAPMGDLIFPKDINAEKDLTAMIVELAQTLFDGPRVHGGLRFNWL